MDDSSLYKKMKTNELDLPEPEVISMDGNRLPYVFIGDEAFGLNEHMLRPYSASRYREKNVCSTIDFPEHADTSNVRLEF